MLQNSISVALKEWAVVERSLLEQHQIMLIRKGGLVEENGDFELRAKQFVILPTYEHESERRGDLQPCFEAWLNESERSRPQDGFVRIECACCVSDVIRVEDREKLVHLMPQHIWSRHFIDGRFEWEPYKPVFVLLVQAYRLAAPVLMPFRREYGGCRSWVTLETAIDTTGANPAIGRADSYERRLKLTAEALSA